MFNVTPDWNAVAAIAAVLALALSLTALIRGERRAAAADARAAKEEKRRDEETARVAALERQSAAQFKIVLLGGTSFEDFPLLGIEVNGTETVRGLAIDPESIMQVGVGGGTIWMSAEPGEILTHFWFRTNNVQDWPKTIRLTFDHPFQGSRILRVPKP